MRKLIFVSMVVVVMLLAWSFSATAQPQEPTNEEKPTFYRLIPGTYVNGWPRFTVTYPKEWIERPSLTFGGQVFCVSPPGPAGPPTLMVHVGAVPYRLDEFADSTVPFFKALGATEVTVVSDKATQLRDGTPAREVEFQMVVNGKLANVVDLATKKDDLLVMVGIAMQRGELGEDLKAILYSLEFQQGKDEPVKVPSDVQDFLNKFHNDIVSHDVAIVMANYSDRYMNSGVRKGEMERFWRQAIGSVTLSKVVITDFVAEGDKAYLAGFQFTNLWKGMLQETSIIKENGEWKWYGNQRDVSP